jgi:hypothetical protein
MPPSSAKKSGTKKAAIDQQINPPETATKIPELQFGNGIGLKHKLHRPLPQQRRTFGYWQ